jgi:GAF domain-containing protein
VLKAGENSAKKLAEKLFDEEALGATSAKLLAAEAFLEVLTRDGRFVDFTREILRVLLKALPCEAGSIFELDHRNQTLFFRAVEGQSADRVHGFVIPFGQGVVGHVAESRQPMVVNSVESEKRHLKSISDAAGFPVRNLLAVPLMIRGRVFGVVEWLNRLGEASFLPPDVELAQSLALQASRAIEVRLMLAWAMARGEEKAKKDVA